MSHQEKKNEDKDDDKSEPVVMTADGIASDGPEVNCIDKLLRLDLMI